MRDKIRKHKLVEKKPAEGAGKDTAKKAAAEAGDEAEDGFPPVLKGIIIARLET